MSEEEPIKVNINDLKIEELTIEEQEAFNYFENYNGEVTFETNIDGDKFFEALGIKKEENFGKLQYKISTLLNLINKQQKELENSVSKDKIREKMQEYYEKASPYDCDTADYKQSQEIGGWNALRKLLEEII